MNENTVAGFGSQAGVVARPGYVEAAGVPKFHYEVVCFDADGAEKWRDDFTNLVTTAGKNDIVDKYFKGSAYTAGWYLG